MRILILVLLSFFLIPGCKIKDAEEPVKETAPVPGSVNNTLKQIFYKGMYSFSDNKGKFTECGTGKKFLLSFLGANKTLDSAYRTYPESRSMKKLYITAEGFPSVDQKKDGKGFDTVLVITKIVTTDTVFVCE